MTIRRITPHPTLEHLKKEAKRWLKELRANDTEARARLDRANPKVPADPGLRDVQHALALEHGASGWTALKKTIESQAPAKYERLAEDMVTVYATSDPAAMQRINDHYGRSSTVEDFRATVWRLIYKVRQADGAADAFGPSEARELIARTSGFNNWSALTESIAKGISAAAHSIDAKENRIAPRRDLAPSEWDTIAGVIKERGITAMAANGFMTDDALERISQLDRVINLDLGGCRQLTDEGLRHLARMPQLEYLDLSEYPGGKLTDRGLEVLRHLPNLRTFKMTWQRGITDAGVANLRFCEKLENVHLMGTPTGDGVIRALRGKPTLRSLETGRLVTDTGLVLLHDFPRFKTWSASDDPEPTRLLIDGPFTNHGLASLAGLDGVFALDLFWHVTGITTDAFEVLPHLAHLGSLGCDGALSCDRAMVHIAAIPRLRKLRAQGSAATDDGFISLSHSTSLETFWGREAPHLTGRGFVALARMPSLRALGVSCKNVDDRALASLPDFPALRELTPIDVTDEGFRYVGRCVQLERLSCMYCRTTTDAATEQIAGLQLQFYYAGLTQITDRSLEILGRMLSLESIELYETKAVTGAGLPFLAALPRLSEIHLSGLPNVTLESTAVFPSSVRVYHSV